MDISEFLQYAELAKGAEDQMLVENLELSIVVQGFTRKKDFFPESEEQSGIRSIFARPKLTEITKCRKEL